MNKNRKASNLINVFQYDEATGNVGINGVPVSGYGMYLHTTVNDGSVGVDSSANINAIYLLKNSTKQFEISYDSATTKIFRLLPYQSTSFFEIGNPSNAGADYVFISESTYGNVIIGPGLGNATGNLTGATASIHKVQLHGKVFADDTIQAAGFKVTGGTGLLKADGTTDTTTYLSGNQTITISGDASGSGATAITLTLADSGVTAGSYGSSTQVPVITVDSKGRVTGVTTASISGSLTFTGDVTGTGTTGSSTALTLAASGVTAGTYTKVTVNAKGLVTVGASASTSDISEGTNLYYTDARVLSYLTTNSYATQSYVGTQIANLVASAPAALDTLNELAAALGNDASFSTTVSTALGNRLRVDIGTQNLTSTQQGYGRTNLGLGTAATSNTGDFAAASHTHTISNVTGLQTALDGKEPTITAGTTSQYWRGDKSWQTLNTSAVAEGTNLYYTDTRARAAITLTTTGSSGAATYSGGTLNIPTYTLSGLGGQPALSGTGFVKISGTTISYDNSTYLTGITSSQVTTALGYTPYNATNPNGYISSYTETDTLASVTGRGASTTTRTTFVEVGVTKAGSDTVAAGPWFRWTNVAEDRQMLAQLNASNGLTYWAYNGSAWSSAFTITQGGGIIAGSTVSYGAGSSKGALSYDGSSYITLEASTTNTSIRLIPTGTGTANVGTNVILHAGNYSSYALPLSGGTMSGNLINGSGTTSSIPSWMKIITTDASQSGLGSVLSNKAIYLFNNGSTLKLDAYDYSTSTGLNFSIGGNGGTVNIATGATVNSNVILHAGNYSSYALPLSGGTMSGDITLAGYRVKDLTSTNRGIFIGNWGGAGYWGLGSTSNAHELKLDQVSSSTGFWEGATDVNLYLGSNRLVLHSSNYSSYALPISGGTLTGLLTIQNAGGKNLWYVNSSAEEFLYAEDNATASARRYYNYAANEHRFYAINASGTTTGVKLMEYDGSNYQRVLNSSNYTSYAVPTGRTITINGTSYDLSANRSWTVTASATWSGLSSGYRENYDLGFRPADNSSSYAGFRFGSPGNDANAGYLLVRGGSDNDVYTQNGLTIVADLGWLTLAQRTTASKGVRIMTGTTSAVRVSVTDSSTTINNTLTLASLASNDGMIENNTGGYFHLGGWGVSRTHATAILVNTAYWADNAGTSDNSNAIGGVSIGNLVRKDATSQYLKPYYEYGSYLTTEAPSTLTSQMGGGGLRVDFANYQYTAHSDWGHIITFSGYNRYSMCQLQSNYYTSDHRLWYRQTNYHNDSWLGWKEFAFKGDAATFATVSANDVYTTGGWFRNHTNNNGIYWSGTGWHLYPYDANDFYMRSGSNESSIRFLRSDGTVLGYVHNASDFAMGFLTSGRSWRLRVENGGRLQAYGPIARSAHAAGFLEGSYNNIGGNSDKTNPIYTIGSSYNPSDTALNSMYGIGYAHPNLWGSGKTNGWGMYVCSAGVIDVTLGGDGGSTSIWAKTDIVAYSDARVKENVEVITDAIEKVKAIRGVTFTRNDVKDKEKRSAGVIAQEVLAVLPEVVSGTEEDMYSVAYGNLTSLLIEAIKEQQQQIEELKNKLDGLTK